MSINNYMERLKAECRYIEDAIISVLNSRPRYLRRIPKKFYVRHFLEIHKYGRPEVNVENNGGNYSITSTIVVRIYDKLRRKYVNF